MAKSTTKTTAAKRALKAAAKASATQSSPASRDQLAASAKAAEPVGDHTHLASPSEETTQRKEATKPAAVKEAVKAGKKDPIEKFGDPDADPVETAARRAVFG